MPTSTQIHLPGQVWHYIAQEHHLVPELVKGSILPKMSGISIAARGVRPDVRTKGSLANQKGAKLC